MKKRAGDVVGFSFSMLFKCEAHESIRPDLISSWGFSELNNSLVAQVKSSSYNLYQLHYQVMSTTLHSFYKNNILFNLSFSYLNNIILFIQWIFSVRFTMCVILVLLIFLLFQLKHIMLC